MARIQRFCFAALILAFLTITVVTVSGSPAQAPGDVNSFRDLLATVEPAALHEVLHEHLKEKFKHGVYPEDRTAMEVVHKQNAEVAHSLVELAKRQAGGTNGTITTSSSTPVDTLTTTSTPIDTLTTTPTPTPTPTPTSPTTLSTTTRGSESQSPTPSPTASTTASRTSSASSSATHKSESSVTQSVVYTTTMPDGAVTTITKVTVVNAGQANGQNNGGSNTNTAEAGLQTGAAVGAHQVKFGPCLGFMGVALAWAL